MSGSASVWITILALLAAGILAASALIISKKPSAKELIDKLVPFQGALGVGLLAWGLIDLLRSLGHLGDFMKFWPLGGAIFLIAIGSEIVLGFLFGMPLIAKWIPGESSAEAKALQMQKKVAGMSVLFGIIGIAAALGLMLMYFGVVKPGT
jgi:hypothetical protein